MLSFNPSMCRSWGRRGGAKDFFDIYIPLTLGGFYCCYLVCRYSIHVPSDIRILKHVFIALKHVATHNCIRNPAEVIAFNPYCMRCHLTTTCIKYKPVLCSYKVCCQVLKVSESQKPLLYGFGGGVLQNRSRTTIVKLQIICNLKL